MDTIKGTSNLLDLYMYATGVSEIPDAWHEWCAISLIAATMGNRVWYQKFAWEKMTPHMYVFLVGPSGCGKGAAMGFAKQLLPETVNYFEGSITNKGLIEYMAGPSEAGKPVKSTMFLVQPELADCVGSGQIASAFVKAVTSWYTPNSKEYQEITRQHGQRTVAPPCITWLAGTTEEWLQQTIDKPAMLSGFFGRVVVSPGEYDISNRVYQPFVPADYEQVLDYIRDRLEWLAQLEGEFRLNAGAVEVDKEWYMTRPEPEPEFQAFWRRQHDLILKLGMVLSLCESMDMVIKEHHILKAQEMTDAAAEMLPPIVANAQSSDWLMKIERVKQFGLRSKEIAHTRLLQNVTRWGIDAEQLKKIILHLQEADVVTVRWGTNKKRYYQFQKKGRKLRMPTV